MRASSEACGRWNRLQQKYNIASERTRLMLNKNYGDVTEAGGIKYAPRKFIEGDGVFVPRVDDDEAYFARGWFKVIDNKPEYDAVS